MIYFEHRKSYTKHLLNFLLPFVKLSTSFSGVIVTSEELAIVVKQTSEVVNKQIKIFLYFCKKKIRSGGDENKKQMQIKRQNRSKYRMRKIITRTNRKY